MSLWHCADCTAAYSVGAPRCPHCSSTERVEDTPAAVGAGEGAGEGADEGADEAESTAPPKSRNTRVQAGVAVGTGEAIL